MGNRTSNEDSYESNEKFLKETSNEYHMNHMNNRLSVKERDYMISKAMKKLGIIAPYKPAVAKAANYLDGDRFWQIYEYAQKAKSPAHYFIKAINRELYA